MSKTDNKLLGEFLMSKAIDGRLLHNAPKPVEDAFTLWRQGTITQEQLRNHIDELAKTDPAIKSFREAKLAGLDSPDDVDFMDAI